MPRAIFIENDRLVYVRGDRELVLDGNAGGYVWTWDANGNRKQIMGGGDFMGAADYWPAGRVTNYEQFTTRVGTVAHRPIYEDAPLADALAYFSKRFGAKAYKSRASYERHFRHED